MAGRDKEIKEKKTKKYQSHHFLCWLDLAFIIKKKLFSTEVPLFNGT